MTELQVAIIGAGPRGTAVLQQLIALVPREPPASVRVHVVEPGTPGAGRVWAPDQPAELLMNSPSGPTDLLATDGPAAVPGFAGWLSRQPADGDAACPGFTPRRTVGRYLQEMFGSLRHANSGVQVVVHPSRAVRLRDAGGPRGSQLLELADRTALRVDAVILAQGHTDSGPTSEERRRAAAAAGGGWSYQATGMTTVDRADALPAGRPIALRGFGLAAIDLVALLTQGRGGRFTGGGGNGLRYLASGAEPVIFIGSRRGLPYRGKPPLGSPVPPTQAPLFLTAETLGAMGGDHYDFGTQIWPLLRAEVTAAYYRQVRTMGGWSDAESFRHLLGGVSGRPRHLSVLAGRPARLADRAVADPALRCHDGWWDPYLPGRPPTADVRGAVLADLAQCRLPDYPARLAARAAFVRATEAVIALHHGRRLSRPSAGRDVAGWFEPLASALTSGPPPGRLRQLLALADAGVVRFLGGAMTAVCTPGGLRVAGLEHHHPTAVDALVEARLPTPDLADTSDGLIAGLLAVGDACPISDGASAASRASSPGPRPVTALAVDAGHRLLDRRGRAHPRRWAAGPLVRVMPPAPPDLTRPPELSVPSPRQVDRSIVQQVLGLRTRRLSTAPTAADAFASARVETPVEVPG